MLSSCDCQQYLPDWVGYLRAPTRGIHLPLHSCASSLWVSWLALPGLADFCLALQDSARLSCVPMVFFFKQASLIKEKSLKRGACSKERGFPSPAKALHLAGSALFQCAYLLTVVVSKIRAIAGAAGLAVPFIIVSPLSAPTKTRASPSHAREIRFSPA